ncbi:VCBS repeat-containing protein [Thermoleophilia bacterium SCSIO 60948]|nr:VCBS repeat-containing protein [Thermoleophilia bacterium SCSIO 60948]
MRNRTSLLFLLAATVAVALAWALPATAATPVRGVDKAADAGIADTTKSHGATVADFDGDGLEDILIVLHNTRFPRLEINQGDGTYADRTAQLFPSNPGVDDYHSCPAADIDRDGDIDFYCTHGGNRGGVGPNANELWVQGADGTFSERAREYRVGDPYGRGREATFIDADGDEWPDLFVGNTFPRDDGRSGANRFFLGVDGTRFRAAPGFGLNRTIGGDNLAAARDMDRDGDEDLVICSKTGLWLFDNVRERRFRGERLTRRNEDSCRDAYVGRWNDDARPDIALASRTRVRVLTGRANGRFGQIASRAADDVGSVALGDVDGDGRDDVYLVRLGEDRPGEPASTPDRTDRLYLNRRGGRRLAPQPIPQTRTGLGESATPLDYDRNGLDDFLVLNGLRESQGPITLLAFFRR